MFGATTTTGAGGNAGSVSAVTVGGGPGTPSSPDAFETAVSAAPAPSAIRRARAAARAALTTSETTLDVSGAAGLQPVLGYTPTKWSAEIASCVGEVARPSTRATAVANAPCVGVPGATT